MKLIEEHYLKNYDTFVNKAYRALGDYHYAEDCVQSSYESAIKYFNTFDGDNFGAWFFTIFLNTKRKFLRDIQSKGVTQEINTSHHPLFPEGILDRYSGIIKEEIKKSDKKPAIKQALTLFFINGYSGKEVALLTGMSETTIHAHTSRFKTHLLEKYEMLR